MKFELKASSCWSSEEFEQEYVPFLKECGVECTKCKEEGERDSYWVADIDSLGVLMYIVSRSCKIILSDFSKHYSNGELDGSIEFYDAWRE